VAEVAPGPGGQRRGQKELRARGRPTKRRGAYPDGSIGQAAVSLLDSRPFECLREGTMADPICSEPICHPLGRRRLMVAIAGGLLAAPFTVEAHQPAKTARLSFLTVSADSDPPADLLLGLCELGWVEGRTLTPRAPRDSEPGGSARHVGGRSRPAKGGPHRDIVNTGRPRCQACNHDYSDRRDVRR
jgi:hypothetical protein